MLDNDALETRKRGLGIVSRIRRLLWLDHVFVHSRMRHDQAESECPSCGKWVELPIPGVMTCVTCSCGATFYPCDHCIDVQTSDALEEAISSLDSTVIVNFWCHGIGPCAYGMKRVEQVARASHGRFVFLRVHIDLVPNAIETYQIRKTPTLLRFTDGEIDGRIDGCVLREDLMSFALHGVDLRFEDG